MYILKHRHTRRVYAIFATYAAAIAQYELERGDNIAIDMYEVPDDDITVPWKEAHRIKSPTRKTVDEDKDWEKYDEIMGLSEA